MEWLIDIAIYLGSALMVWNIIRYARFIQNLLRMERQMFRRGLLDVPLFLLIFFLVGYLLVGIFGSPDLVIAGILFGGSVFVFLLLTVIYQIVGRVREGEAALAARYDETRREINQLTKSQLAAFRVDLTTDLIEERTGLDLYDCDKTAVTYSELLDHRQPYLLSPAESVGVFRREELLRRFRDGQSEFSEIVLGRRQSGRACFMKLRAMLVEQPSTGDVTAFITEQDYNDSAVGETILQKALMEQNDMIVYVVEGDFTVVGAKENTNRKGFLLSERCGKYDDCLTRIAGLFRGTEEERGELLSRLSSERVMRELARSASYEVPAACEIDGELRYKRFTYYPVDLTASFFLLMVSDTTELHREQTRQNEILANALEEARNANQAKTVFFSNMSHDIRTPMNAIIGFTEQATHTDDREKIRGYLAKISASGEHLLALINDVLEMSRIESGKMEPEPIETDLPRLVEEVRDVFAAQAQEKRVELTVAADVRDRHVMCDRNRMNRVLLNLVSNACKYTPSGGSVAVTLKQTGETDGVADYELAVSDTGIGMSEEFAATVFDAYTRERHSGVTAIQGTGLGMAITKSIVDMMGGTIEVQTAPGAGTTFLVRVSFPIVEAPAKASVAETAAPTVDFSKVRVLLTDDNEINREIAGLVLTTSGCSFEEAVNGDDAVSRIAEAPAGHFDLVLMDIQMPGMNGYEATRAIRAMDDPKKSSIPIIALTANAFREDVRQQIEAGMNGHIAKPFDADTMMRTIAEVLSTGKQSL